MERSEAGGEAPWRAANAMRVSPIIQRAFYPHSFNSSDFARGCIDVMSEYGRLLAESGLSKRRLAEMCGVHEDSVSRWGDDAPRYALTILRLLVRAKRLSEDL